MSLTYYLSRTEKTGAFIFVRNNTRYTRRSQEDLELELYTEAALSSGQLVAPR